LVLKIGDYIVPELKFIPVEFMYVAIAAFLPMETFLWLRAVV